MKIYPAIDFATLSLPRSYKKMNSITLKGQLIVSGQYVLAKGLSSDTTGLWPCTVVSDPSLRPAKIDHFVIHSFCIDVNTRGTHCFAVVSWPMSQPLHLVLGKPYEVYSC